MRQVDSEQWITNRADELALSIYGANYYDLPSQLQSELFSMAELDYIDMQANRVSALPQFDDA